MSGTAIAAHTVNFDILTELPFTSTMLDTASAAQGSSIRDTEYHAWVAVRRTLEAHSLQDELTDALAAEATDQYLVELGEALMDAIDGPHFMPLGPIFGSKTKMVSHARHMIGLFKDQERARTRVVVPIPATEEGLLAAQILKNEDGIQTNLCFVSGFVHALACIEAGASYISFSCRLLDSVALPQMRMGGTHHRKERQWMAEIMATIEYLTLNNCETQSVLTDLCMRPTPELLGGASVISLRNEELKRLDEGQYIVCPADSDPSLQARQTQYPTSYLAQTHGFLLAMDTPSRLRATSVLSMGCQEARRGRNELISVISAPLKWELHLRKLDAAGLAAMYQHDLEIEANLATMSPSSYCHSDHEGPPGKATPRTNHIGYRIAQITWDKPQEPWCPHSPSVDLPSNDTDHAIEEYLAMVSLSAPDDPWDDVPEDFVPYHPTNPVSRHFKSKHKHDARDQVRSDANADDSKEHSISEEYDDDEVF
ncbi:hypothetical protein BDW22DRAFT_1357708 [Trametopsis cervina]|nr:hypothetical protein BDW22DRAFT_1357708 [Trametopsis cervina]